jgi:hypothetical protein
MMTADLRTIALNGFRVHIRPEEFTAYTVELPENSDLDQLQSEAVDALSLWWNRGTVYGLPLGAGTELPGSAETKLAISEHLGFVANLINLALPRVVPHYKAFRNRPFTFLGSKGEKAAGCLVADRQPMKAIPDAWALRGRGGGERPGQVMVRIASIRLPRRTQPRTRGQRVTKRWCGPDGQVYELAC